MPENGNTTGRTFHSDAQAVYALPNDAEEMDRLDMQHWIWEALLPRPLHLAPLAEDNLSAAVDIGSGSGLWAKEFARKYTGCQVTGTDLFAVSVKGDIPPNANFKVENAQRPWSFDPASLDYVHSRAILAGISDWPHIISEAYKTLRPGGWLELQEISFPKSDDGSMTPDSGLWKWDKVMTATVAVQGIDTQIAFKHASLVECAGFENVQTVDLKSPLGKWMKSEEGQRVGAVGEKNFEGLLEGARKVLVVAGWTEADIEALQAEIRSEMAELKVNAYIPFRITWARKPLGDE